MCSSMHSIPGRYHSQIASGAVNAAELCRGVCFISAFVWVTPLECCSNVKWSTNKILEIWISSVPSLCLPSYLQEYANDLLISSTSPVDQRPSLLPSNDLGSGADTASKRPLRSQSAELGPRGTFCVLHCPFVFIHSMRSTRAEREPRTRTSHTRASERASSAAALRARTTKGAT